MKLDNIEKPVTLWNEDSNGRKYDIFFSNYGPPDPLPDNMYQHSLSLKVGHEICQTYRDAKWPIRAMNWIIQKMPDSWKKRSSHLMSFESTIGGAYPMVKYLVENKKWRMDDACIIYTKLCERCMNVVLWEIDGTDLSTEKHYLDTVHTHCEYCKTIDPIYDQKYKLWVMYRTFKRGGDVGESYKELFNG